MAYLVKVLPRAERDLELIFDYSNVIESEPAFKWYRKLNQQILTLEATPNRNPATPETPAFCHLLYGHKPDVYRVIYRVTEQSKLVEIVHVRHGAISQFNSEQL